MGPCDRGLNPSASNPRRALTGAVRRRRLKGPGRRLGARFSKTGDVEADKFRPGGAGVCAAHPAPAHELRPILGVAGEGIFGDGLAGILAGGLGQPVQGAGAREMGGQGDRRGGVGAGARSGVGRLRIEAATVVFVP